MTGIPNPDHPSVILSHGLRYQILFYFTICKGPWFLLVESPNLRREKKMRNIEMDMPPISSSNSVSYLQYQKSQ